MDTSWGPGRVIAGRYRLVSQLGQGGMGSVWRADHMALSSPVAIKLIDPEIARRPEMLERFQREAQSSAALRSPHVVQILDYGVDDGVPYIAMELLEGESLAARLARVSRLPYPETIRIVSHVGRALAKAHEVGVIHRDLKPDNVFLVKNDDKEIAKVLDFGIAKITGNSLSGGQDHATRTGAILGTPSYMSPEQAQGTKTIDSRSDLWSLAVIAFECVCGRVPFQSLALGDLLIKICVHPIPVPSQIATVPAGFDAWWARASNRDPQLRFQTAKELADALRQALGAEGYPVLSSGALSPGGAVLGGANTVSAAPLHASAGTPIGAEYTPYPPQPTPAPAGAGSTERPPAPPPGQHALPGFGPTLPSPGAQRPGPHYTTAPGASVNVVAPPPRSRAPMVAVAALCALVAVGIGAWIAVGRGTAAEPRSSQAPLPAASLPAPPQIVPAPPQTVAAATPEPIVAPKPTPPAAEVTTTTTVVPATVARPVAPKPHGPSLPPTPPVNITLQLPPPPPPTAPPPVAPKQPDRVGF